VRKVGFRSLFILGFIALAGYYLYPTWRDSQFQEKLKTLSGKDSAKYFDDHEEAIRSARAGRIKLGLDLQGGMYVTMEVDVLSMLEKSAKNKDERLHLLVDAARKEAATSEDPPIEIFRRQFDNANLRMSRYYGDIRNSNDEIAAKLKDEADKAVSQAEEIIRNRIDKYGVSEVSITRSGSQRLVLELPGVSNEKEVRSLIQETAQLEFKLFADPKLVKTTIENIDKTLLGQNIEALTDTSATADSARADSAKTVARADSAKRITDTSTAGLTEDQRNAKFKAEHPFQSLFVGYQGMEMFAYASQKERISNILNRPDVQRVIPPDIKFSWGAKEARQQAPGNDPYVILYPLKAEPELTGEYITDARAQINQQGFGGAVVTMTMDETGSQEWARITGANVNKQIAIVLDDAVFSAPNVKQKIIGGNSQIEGMANLDEARLLEIVLKAGALPAPVQIIQERTVGPSLGEDSIQKGMYSFWIGVGIVLLFMIAYYLTAGIAADIAVVFNVAFILGILAGFSATLTLPGIAGILLTVGMAVDANVLINERVREELALGKTMRAALEAGYSRAMPAIIDSNVTTIITCIILYQLGSGPVQGFALTLMIGLICSMFTAIIMTRVLFEVALDKYPGLVKFG
jgi:SecD/SecF fusion protein